MVKGKGKR